MTAQVVSKIIGLYRQSRARSITLWFRGFYPMLYPRDSRLTKTQGRTACKRDDVFMHSSLFFRVYIDAQWRGIKASTSPLFTDRRYFSTPRTPERGALAPVSGTGCCWRVKVGTIYTLAENPGEISRFECLGRPRGISGRLARVQCTLPAKQWALLNIRRRCMLSEAVEDTKRKGTQGGETEARCHLHINCPPKIILTFNFPLPGRLTIYLHHSCAV